MSLDLTMLAGTTASKPKDICFYGLQLLSVQCKVHSTLIFPSPTVIIKQMKTRMFYYDVKLTNISDLRQTLVPSNRSKSLLVTAKVYEVYCLHQFSTKLKTVL